MSSFKFSQVIICLILILTGLRQVSLQQTIIKLYTVSTQSSPTSVTINQDLSQVNGYCSSNCSNYLVIHGWQASQSSWMEKAMTELFKSSQRINVFIVDWSFGSDVPGQGLIDIFGYETSIRRMNQTVREINSFFTEYIKKGYVTQLNCIGHSLGAHLCGLTGKVLKASGFTISKIFAQDPAGPCFDAYPRTNRLDQTDADFVSVIHTSKFLGFNGPLGHADFYPNGGTRQPGCYPGNRWSVVTILLCDKAIDFGIPDPESVINPRGIPAPNIFSVCSHGRANDYFIESINSKCGFTSTQCYNWNQFQKGLCKSCLQNQMGFASYRSAKSSYFLDVNSRPDHCVAVNYPAGPGRDKYCVSRASHLHQAVYPLLFVSILTFFQ